MSNIIGSIVISLLILGSGVYGIAKLSYKNGYDKGINDVMKLIDAVHKLNPKDVSTSLNI